MPDEIEPPKAADALPESDPVIEAEVQMEAEVESAEMDTSVIEQDLPPTADAQRIANHITTKSHLCLRKHKPFRCRVWTHR